MAAGAVFSRSQKCAARRRSDGGLQARTFLRLVLEAGIGGILIALPHLLRKRWGRLAYAVVCRGLISICLVFRAWHRRASLCSPTSVHLVRKRIRNPVALVAGLSNGFSSCFPGCDRRFCGRCLSGIFPPLEPAKIAPGTDSCRVVLASSIGAGSSQACCSPKLRRALESTE